MYKKKSWLILLAVLLTVCLLAGCNGTGGGTTGPDGPDGEPAIILSQSEAKLGIGGTLYLTAETRGTEENVVWASSDDTVAAVGDGEIMGMREGDAVITASAGSLTAQCRVSVSADVPALIVDPQYVVVDLKESCTVTAQVVVDGQDYQTPVAYQWSWDKEAEKIISVKPSEDGSSAAVTGLAYGDATLYVDVQVGGVSLTKKLTVSCRNTDIAIELSGEGISPAVGGYDMAIEIATSITPKVTVYNKDVKVNSGRIKWSVKDSSIAAVSADGTVTALKEGSTVVTGTYGEQNNKVRIFVSVFRPVVNMKTAYVVETSVGTLTVTDSLTGTIQGATINGVDVFESAEGNVITFKKSALPTLASQMGPGRALVIHTDRAQYTYSAEVYSKIITTAQEFMVMDEYMHRATGSNGYYQFTGYVVLGNDIDLEGAAFNLFEQVQIDPSAPAGDRNNANVGLNGIFDGRGFRVKNYTATPGVDAMFTHLGHQGVIRNVSIENIASPNGADNILMRTHNGIIENVYISLSQWDAGALLSSPYREVRKLRNVVIEYTGEPIADWRDITGHYGDGSLDSQFYLHRGNNIQNVYIVGNIGSVKTGCELSGCGSSCGFHSFKSIQEASKNNFSAFSGSFWNTDSGIPVPSAVHAERAAQAVVIENIRVNGEFEALKGESLKLLSNTPYVIWSLQGSWPGVTLEGNLLTVAADSAAAAVTVKATNLFDTSKTATAVFHLYSKTVQPLDALGDLELKKTQDQKAVTLDLSKVDPIGQVTTIVINDRMLGADQFTVNTAEKTVSVPTEHWQPYYGQAVNIAVNCKNGDHYTQATTTAFVLSKVITTAAEYMTMESYMDRSEGNNGYYQYTGYVALGSDIDLAGEAFDLFEEVQIDPKAPAGDKNNINVGLNGTVDGRGHRVKNYKATLGVDGMFTHFGRLGVIKNLSIENVVAPDGTDNILMRTHNGIIENVYVSITKWDSGAVFSSPYRDVRKLSNVVIEYTGEPISGWRDICGHWGDGSDPSQYYFHSPQNIKNVYIVGNIEQIKTACDDKCADGACGFHTYKNVVEAAAAGNDYSAFGSMWDTSNGLPVPVKVVTERFQQEIIITNTEKIAAKGKSITMKANVDYAAWYLQEAYPGVALRGNVLEIDSNAPSGQIRIVAANVYNSAKTAVYTLEVAQVSEQHLSNIGDLELRAAPSQTEVVLELSGAVAFTQIIDVKVNETGVPFTLSGAKGIAVSTELLKQYLGQDIRFSVTCKTAGGYNTVIIPGFVVSKVITTTEEFNAMESYMEVADNKYTGYIVLGGSIDFDQAVFKPQFQQATVGGTLMPTVGMNGTIDGRGYALTGINMTAGSGIFGVIGKDGLIKDMAIQIGDASANVVARACWGSVEDVYVTVGNWTAGAMLNVPFSTTANITRVVFEFTGGSGYKLSDGQGYQNITDSYIIGSFEADGVDMRNVPQFDSRAAMAAAGQYSTFISGDADFWQLKPDGTPIPKAEIHIHSYTRQTAEPQYLASAATAAAPANYYYSCSCGKHNGQTFPYGEPVVAEPVADLELNADSGSTVSVRIPAISGTVTAVALNESTLNPGDYTLEGQTLTLNKALLNGYLGKDILLMLRTDGGEKIYTAQVVSKVITTAEEFNAMESYMEAADNKYTGYIVLGGNIDFSQTPLKPQFQQATVGGTLAPAVGLNGTIDGRGYALTGVNITSGSGIFGVMGQNAVLKNIAIYIGDASTNVVARACWGSLEDVYVCVDNWTAGAMLNVPFSTTANITRVIFEFTGGSGYKLSDGQGYRNITDSYIIGSFEADGVDMRNVPQFDSRAAMAAAGEYSVFTSGNGDFWKLMADGTPTPKVEIHTHSYTIEAAEPQYLAAVATSAAPAKYYYSCSCGQHGTETFSYGQPITAVSLGDMELKADGAETVSVQITAVSGTLTGVTLNDNALSASDYTLEGQTLTLKKSVLKEYLGKNINLQISTDVGDQIYTATVVSKVITTAQEFNNMMTYLDKTAANANFNSYTGYLVLGNDIDFAGVTVTPLFCRDAGTNSIRIADGGDWNDGAIGFNGTIDGRGYAIKNLTIPGCRGLFGLFGSSSVMKNLIFLDVTANGGTENLFMNNKGLMEDVYIRLKDWQSGYLFGQWSYGGSLKRVIFEYEGTVPGDARCFAYAGGPDMADCYLIGITGIVNPGEFQMYANRTAMVGDHTVFTQANGSFWTLDSKGTPIPKSIHAPGGKDEQTVTLTGISDLELKKEPAQTQVTIDLEQTDAITAVTGVIINDTPAAEGSFTLDGSSLKLNTVELKPYYGKSAAIVVNYETANAKVTATCNVTAVVSKVITTASEFTGLMSNLDKSLVDNNNAKFEGYIVLGNDIDLSSDFYPLFQIGYWQQNNILYETASNHAGHTGQYGFQGTFDGRGYSLKNITLNQAGNVGLFGVVGERAVIKNVSIHFKEASDQGYVLNRNFHGALEDVYVKLDRWIGGTLMNSSSATGKLTRVIFAFDGSQPSSETYPISGRWGSFTAVDSYIIGNLTAATEDGVKAYPDRTAMAEAGNSYTVFIASGFWKLDALGTPIPKKADAAPPVEPPAEKEELTDTLTIADLELKGQAQVMIDLEQVDAITAVTAVTVNAVPVAEGSFALDGGSLKLNTDTLKAYYGKGVTVIVNYETAAAKVTATCNVAAVVSKVITTAQEFNNMMTYLDKTAANANFNSYTGYLVLGNDIDFAGVTVTPLFCRDAGTNSIRIADGGNWNDGAIGFNGTIDGRGYAVKNLNITGGRGWLGLIGANGVIRNLSITDMTASCSDEVLIMNNKGTLEDVSIRIKSWTGTGKLFGHWFNGGKMTRVIAECTGTVPAAAYIFASSAVPTPAPTMTDCYVIGTSNGAQTGDIVVYASREDMAAAANSYAAFTEQDCWTLDEKGLPVFS